MTNQRTSYLGKPRRKAISAAPFRINPLLKRTGKTYTQNGPRECARRRRQEALRNVDR